MKVCIRRRPRRRDHAGWGITARVALGTLLLVATIAGAAEPSSYLRDFRRGNGLINTRRGCIWLDIFYAEGPEQRSQGLMFIRQLDTYEGMIFATPQPVEVTMWMKNTYIPLDMVFIGADGHIAGIAANTRPLTEDLIRSPGPVKLVLELNGGFAGRYGLAKGDRVVLE